MYLHVGEDVLVREEDIIGIFDLDTSTVSAKTKEFLAKAQKEGRVVNLSEDLPKSFVLCRNIDTDLIYVCQPTPATLIRRMGSLG